MGRHGGGSRSGGSSRSSRSSGGSRSGGSGTRSSNTPFVGGYNRSYYDRYGRYHTYYTNDYSFGTQSGWNKGIILALVFVTGHMLLMMVAMLSGLVFFGKKVEGDFNRVFIEDRVNILTPREEQEITELFRQVYDKSGMPVTLYTDNFDWKDHYRSLEAYSEELYYSIGLDEDAMIILFTQEEEDDFVDWEYDMYCGDDTIKCLSDESFDELLDSFQKAMARQDLAEALHYSWNTVIDDLAEFKISNDAIITVLVMALFYGIFYVAILSGVRKKNDAYKYFRENPDQLSSDTVYSNVASTPSTSSYGYSSNTTSYNGYSSGTTYTAPVSTPQKMYSRICNSCGISNDGTEKICSFCGAVLDAKNENTTI